MKKICIVSLWLIAILYPNVLAQRDYSDSEITKLVLLGTGNPNPSPDQSGCALALVVNDTPYIIDFGPGLIRKAAAMTLGNGQDLDVY